MDDEANETHLLKVIFVGDSAVGKTALLTRLCTNDFKPTTATVGMDTRFKRLKFDGKNLILSLWDTAGQERYRSVTSSYYRGAQGVVYVYDVTDRESLDSLHTKWIPESELYLAKADTIRMIVANKIDLDAQRVVSPEEGVQLARKHDCLYRETSARTASGVAEAFIWSLVCSIVKTPSLLSAASEAAQAGSLAITTVQPQRRRCSSGCPRSA